MDEPLKGGPCSKYRRRAELMMSSQHSTIESDLSKGNENTALDKAEENSGETTTNCPIRAIGSETEKEQTAPVVGGSNSVCFKSWAEKYAPEDIAKLQEVDTDISLIRRSMLEGVKPKVHEASKCSRETRHYLVLWDNLKLVNGFQADQQDAYLQLIVPRVLRKEVIRDAHDSVTAGHMGVKMTYKRIT
ncbi:hypothetical protein DPMN_106753 [Dreissena polymorpha]|uniref:Integrase zinc-binding domain-containing protein n=1 Tax=Dreissena polymorpha TaxID=45954 RepID=A0A9D4QIY4_DREPO|nr:hypothetical protein DPMN_106753 [Dreissena polymorpha]